MFTKLRLRIFLAGQGKKLSEKQIDALHEHLHGEFEREHEGHGGRFTDFLSWLLEHKAEIMALIAVLFPK